MSYDKAYFRECERRDRADLASGDIARVLARYHLMIGQLAKRSLGPDAPSDAWEDVRQVVETQLWDDFRKGEMYRGYPYRAVVRRMVEYRARDYRRGNSLYQPLPDGWLPEDRSYAGTIAELEDELTVLAKLDGLSEQERNAFYLVKMMDMSPKDVAEQMQVTRNNVDQMVDRAKRKLRGAGRDDA